MTSDAPGHTHPSTEALIRLKRVCLSTTASMSSTASMSFDYSEYVFRLQQVCLSTAASMSFDCSEYVTYSTTRALYVSNATHGTTTRHITTHHSQHLPPRSGSLVVRGAHVCQQPLRGPWITLWRLCNPMVWCHRVRLHQFAPSSWSLHVCVCVFARVRTNVRVRVCVRVRVRVYLY